MSNSYGSPLSGIAVVGGGPAGAICALLLARTGAQVTLIQRRRHHAAPIELVSARARMILETHLEQPLLQLVNGCEICETVTLWGTLHPESWSAMCNPWGYGLAVNRATFDAALVRATCNAGVSVLEDSEVRNAQRQSNSWILTVRSGQANYTLKAEYLVLATGSGRQTLVERTPVDKPAHFAFMARADVNIPEQRHTFHLEAGQDGWWYGLPDPDGGRFVGFCGHRDAFKRLQRPLQDTFIRQLMGMRLIGNGLAPGTLASAIIGRPAGPQSYDQVAGNWWVAVGDAAFVSDPLSGMGIEFAVESAKLAAKALLAMNRELGLAEYNEAVKEYARYHRRVSAHYHATANSLMHSP